MITPAGGFQIRIVSLFTREWIEMQFEAERTINGLTSPSLRGSGLK